MYEDFDPRILEKHTEACPPIMSSSHRYLKKTGFRLSPEWRKDSSLRHSGESRIRGPGQAPESRDHRSGRPFNGKYVNQFMKRPIRVAGRSAGFLGGDSILLVTCTGWRQASARRRGVAIQPGWEKDSRGSKGREGRFFACISLGYYL